jgi:hypothetical protein
LPSAKVVAFRDISRKQKVMDELAILRSAKQAREALYAVHYACEKFNEVKDAPPAVFCVSFFDVNTSSSYAFGLSNIGTEDTSSREREVLLLQAALKFLHEHSEARWLHWNMSRPEYGFQALADRLAWLGHEPPALPSSDRRHDLPNLISERYGHNYAPHPRLSNLIQMNGISSYRARWGTDEPDLAERKEYTAIQQSVTEKVYLLARIFDLFVDGQLQTENSTGEIPFANNSLNAVSVILAIADRFLLVLRTIRRRHANRATIDVQDEYDAQDLLRALLTQFFEDVRDEEFTPSYAGGASRIDFLLPQKKLAVELKWMRESLTARKLGEELLVDRQRYQAHPKVSHLVCLVFDYDGRLPNPRGIEQDLTQAKEEALVTCTVRIMDR